MSVARIALRRPLSRCARRYIGHTTKALNTAAGTRSHAASNGVTQLHTLMSRKYSGGLFSAASMGHKALQGCWLQYTVKGSSLNSTFTPNQLHFKVRFNSSSAASTMRSVRSTGTGRSYPPAVKRLYITK